MTQSSHDADTPKPVPQSAPDDLAPQTEAARARAEKAMRLASALRANLRRRKAPQRTPVPPKERN